jgi:hypothetical protein
MNHRSSTIALALASAIFAGCSGGGGSGTPPASSTGSAAGQSNTRHALSVGSRSIAGSSTGAYTRYKCATGNDPPAPQWWYENVPSSNGSTATFTTPSTTTAPTSAATEISVSLTVNKGVDVTITLQDPNGTTVHSETDFEYANFTYYAAGAPGGTYTLSVNGVNYSDDGCFATSTTGNGTVSSWTGTMAWN